MSLRPLLAACAVSACVTVEATDAGDATIPASSETTALLGIDAWARHDQAGDRRITGLREGSVIAELSLFEAGGLSFVMQDDGALHDLRIDPAGDAQGATTAAIERLAEVQRRFAIDSRDQDGKADLASLASTEFCRSFRATFDKSPLERYLGFDPLKANWSDSSVSSRLVAATGNGMCLICLGLVIVTVVDVLSPALIDKLVFGLADVLFCSACAYSLGLSAADLIKVTICSEGNAPGGEKR